jgi:Leucine-rich repeat (LRR) protein
MLSLPTINRLIDAYALLTKKEDTLPSTLIPLFEDERILAECSHLFKTVCKYSGYALLNTRFGKDLFFELKDKKTSNKIRILCLKRILNKSTENYLSTILEFLNNFEEEKALEHLAILSSFDPIIVEKIQNYPAPLPQAIESIFLSYFLETWVEKSVEGENRIEIKRRIEAYLNTPSTGTLNLSFLGLTKLPNIFQGNVFKQLKEINLSGNHLHNLPLSFGDMNMLEKVYLSYNQFTEIPEELEELKELTLLDISYNHLTTMPSWLVDFSKLAEIYLDNNPLTEIYETKGNWKPFLAFEQELIFTSLKKWTEEPTEDEDRVLVQQYIEDYLANQNTYNLCLESISFHTLPDIFGTLLFKKTKMLRLSDNDLTFIPESMGSLIYLEILDLSQNKITSLPESFLSLCQLKHLDLTQNTLTCFPESLRNSLQLEELFLADNNICMIPSWIESFSNLKMLDLENNKVISIPNTITKLKKLRHLHLNKNPCTEMFHIKDNWLEFVHASHLSVIIIALQNDELEKASTYLSIIADCFPTTFGAIQNLVPALTLPLTNNPLLPDIQKAIDHVFLSLYLQFWVSEGLSIENREEAKRRIEALSEDDTHLSLSELQLLKLPNIFYVKKFSNLSTISFRKNRLHALPRSLVYLTHLKGIDLRENKFEEFPVILTRLMQLKEIFLNYNLLNFLPNQIERLKNLKRLYLSHNFFSKIPDQLIFLPRLEILCLNNNLINPVFGSRSNWIPFILNELATFFYSDLAYYPHFTNLKSHQPSFNKISIWLKALRTQLRNYTKEDSKKILINTVRDFLEKAECNEKFRGCFLAIIEEASSSCIDGLTLSILHLKLAEIQLEINPRLLQQTYETLSKLVVFQILEKIAKNKIQLLKDQIDVALAEGLPPTQDQMDYGNHISVQRVEREIILIYPSRLKEVFSLPFDLTEMLFGNLTQVTDEDIDAASQEVRTILLDPSKIHALLIENPIWLEALQIHNPERYVAIHAEIEDLIITDPMKAQALRLNLFTAFGIESLNLA